MTHNTTSISYLPNGLRIVVIRQPQSPSVTTGVFVAVGAEHETKQNNGISNVLEHMCFKGTSKRPSQMIISSELESLGAVYNAFTDRDMTGYWVKTATQQFEKALDIVADMYLNPLLPAEELEKEKGVIIEEMNMYQDNPSYKAFETANYLLYGNTPYGRDIIGTKQTLRAMSRDHVMNYRAKHYGAAGTTVVVVGNVDLKHTKKAVAKLFDNLPRGRQYRFPALPPTHKGKVKVIERDTDQTQLVFSMPSLPYKDKRIWAAALMANIMGGSMTSRLFQEVRVRMGAAYSVSVENVLYTAHGMMMISAGVTTERAYEVVRVIMNELDTMVSGGPSKKELLRTKRSAIGRLMLGRETSSQIAMIAGGQLLRQGYIESVSAITRAIRNVNEKDIKNIARRLFDPLHINLAVVGPHHSSAPFIKILHNR